MARENESINPFNNPDLEDTINQHMETSIHNKLMEYSQDKLYKDIREYKATLNNEIKNIDEYIKNNRNNIIDKYNFQEGFNNRTGKEETYNTLLDEYRINKVRDIKNELDENTSLSTLNEMQKSDNINMHKSETENDLKEYPIIKDNLNSFEQNLDDVVQESKSNLKDVKFEISEDRKTYNITTINTKNKESNHTFEFNNIADYKEMKNIENNKLEIEYDEYKDKAVNIVKNSSEDIHKIERELENYDFASEKYNEYLKDKYTDFNQYLKDNNISNPYEKYSEDLIKNTKAYSDIRLKMEEIDDEHFSQHGKHVSNYIDYGEEIKSTSQNLQKLKSVELEKNVIGLLPKDQQENNYRETLSRLDKNKSTLKEDLKSYMSNTKIDNAINSVKHHFENIKVKAEDIHQNFKDLGSWNTENKYVKNINDVVDKIKNLSQKNENKIDLNDPELLKKLETKFKESNDYINKIENINLQDQKLKDNHLNYLSNSLEISNPTLAKETNTITESLSDLSKEDKLNLYNHSKDIESITHDSNFHKPEDIKTIVETHKLTNAIEKDLGKSTVDESRKDYLVSNVKKPAINENFSDNPKLKSYMNNSNDFIQNTSKNDLKKYQERGNVEINKINDNKKANTLKNNDLLQRYNKQEVKQNTNNTSIAEENINEKQQQTKKQGIQIR